MILMEITLCNHHRHLRQLWKLLPMISLAQDGILKTGILDNCTMRSLVNTSQPVLVAEDLFGRIRTLGHRPYFREAPRTNSTVLQNHPLLFRRIAP